MGLKEKIFEVGFCLFQNKRSARQERSLFQDGRWWCRRSL